MRRKLKKTYYITMTAKRKNAVRYIHRKVMSDNVNEVLAMATGCSNVNPRYNYNVYSANWELIK